MMVLIPISLYTFFERCVHVVNVFPFIAATGESGVRRSQARDCGLLEEIQR